jgi:GrpB-like predicted nucleotidyltransferase (UPF0157 family)
MGPITSRSDQVRDHRRMTDTADGVVDYDEDWSSQFSSLARSLRNSLGPRARRIDHIGSTSVPGLAAKPIIDVQVSVTDLEAVGEYRSAIEACGFEWRADNPDITKRYFREQPPRPRTHIHVRQSGTFSEQAALLFRDYLRLHPPQADSYAAMKRQAADLLKTNRATYVEAKSPFIWRTLHDADLWAQSTGERPGPSDA